MNSKKKKKKKKVLYRKQVDKILAIPGQMTAKEFADIVLLKPLPGSEVDKAYHYPEVSGIKARRSGHTEANLGVTFNDFRSRGKKVAAATRQWQNEMDNALIDL